MTETGWLSDPIGRINNISLAPSPKNTLQPMFEAMMNSIHAIEERFGNNRLSEGKIDIEITKDDSGVYDGFIIQDNGIGLNEENMIAFRKSDTMKKAKNGGKGVGRLLWLKVAEKIAVKSQYNSDTEVRLIQFDFVADPDKPISNLIESSGNGDAGTTIMLTPLKRTYANYIPTRLDTIAVRTVAHFINYFVNIGCPTITLSDSSRQVTLFDKFTDDIERDRKFEISLSINEEVHALSFNCFLVPKNYSDDEKGTNGLFFGAHGRAVTRDNMDNVIGLKTIDGKFAFFGYLEGRLLDDAVNDTRTAFSLDEEIIESLKRESIAKMHEFLKSEIDLVRERQLKTVVKVRNEHLRFFNIARDPKEFAEKLMLSTQSEEDIFIEMSRYGLRQYKRVRKDFQEAKDQQLPEIEAKAKDYVAELRQESLSSLAEYIYKRRLILDAFEDALTFKDKESTTTHYEQVVHDLICPLRSTSSELNYEDHNLWVIDDRLAFYSYFNSDKRLEVQSTSKSYRRPDITFFDLGMGFDKEASREPITIIEFKRPKRDDYTMADNPFLQVQRYVAELRNAGVATRYDGRFIRTIESNTPFLCQIIADDTDSLRGVMEHLGGFYRKAGSQSYYRWDENFRAFMEVTSYSDLLSDAKARHAAFFEKLGISP